MDERKTELTKKLIEKIYTCRQMSTLKKVSVLYEFARKYVRRKKGNMSAFYIENK